MATTEKQDETETEHDGFLAEAESGLLHLVHQDGENYIAPERIVEVGAGMIEVEDGGDPIYTAYVIIDGADEQLDVPGIELEQIVAAWAKLRKGKV